MRILHYSLGLPPYRTGGMTKFCTDLMLRQRENGETVALLWPGRISVMSKKVKIEKKDVICGIDNYEIVNPLPIPLKEGIRNIPQYTLNCRNSEVYEQFLDKFNPDVIHIHTLMGLHQEFVEIAKCKGVKIVFTTHDYFGICPKVTMFRNGEVCQDVDNCSYCNICNKNALDIKKIVLLQSPIYRKFKDWSLMKLLRKTFKEKFFKEKNIEYVGEIITSKSNEYIELRKYYANILQMVDSFHYNSSLAKEVYEKYVKDIENKGHVINISHNDIKDNKNLKKFTDTVKLTYLSPDIESKGYKMLMSVLDELWNQGEHWFKLNLYGEYPAKYSFVENYHRYEYDDMEHIFQNTDVLVAPSLWYETFGYTVLEALSFGVPVIITENVGAKDLLKGEEFGIVIKPEREALREAIISIKNTDRLVEFNENIVKNFDIKKSVEFHNQIMDLY